MTQVTVLTGRATLLSGSDKTSAIAKTPMTDACYLGWEGFEVDEQADRRLHGGVEKAVHHYPFEHYATWQHELGNLSVLRSAGAFGENLSTIGLLEHTVAVGDIFRLGEATLQVSQGRQPCWKLNLRFGVSDMALRLQNSGRTGWYYRVLEPGMVGCSDTLIKLDSPSPEWTLYRIWHSLYVDTLNFDVLSVIAGLEGLSDSWRKIASKRLQKRQVENWNPRLYSR
ncbi:MOSC domain-containing protein YiiM [Chromohalobacter marismortui]|uniref:MOSC domain-containing protein YiiM n=1 Tax=Chromohalobacter marismortui TaxID=42055 RepID=A0A4R7NSF2_9GAMM|nr:MULTISPECIES: MOSC domain-containing protein [Chromohalobacter]MCI0509329.1 MOSC domain-containing protein [Chromohalobacter sp.]MCI0592334.1 MOSC domain-containing protein [Chromohalobacter sp.]TDU23778.1 MOSC domain-containing protein YiiM [Chromohalobacter marismortui]